MTARRFVPVLAAAAAAVALSGCGSGTAPLARDAANCLAPAGALIRSAPPSASDPATGPWLGRLDHLRDMARKAGDVTSRQLAAELDWAGSQVALDGVPPQLAIVPAQETCTLSDLSSASAPASVIPAARAWLQVNPPPARPGMTAGLITRWTGKWLACPSAGRGSRVAVGNGCPVWTVTLTTAAGTLGASCGSGSVACTSATAQPGPHEYFPGIGDELYVPDDGLVTRAADITIISQPPWDAWSAQASGPVGS
jgi:hypothetical protein